MTAHLEMANRMLARAGKTRRTTGCTPDAIDMALEHLRSYLTEE